MMIADQIKELKDQIAHKQKLISALHTLAERVPEAMNVSIGYAGTIDFDWPETREETTKLMQQIGSRTWKKEISNHGEDKVDYIADDPDLGVKVRIYGAPPPPSCRIVEFEEAVPPQPATTRKVRKLVCIEPEAQPA